MSERLYARLEQLCDRHVQDLVTQLTRISTDFSEFLVQVNARWEDHCRQMLDIRQIFLYLDRTYALQSMTIKPIWDMGLSLFRTYFTRASAVLRKTIQAILDTIESERNGLAIDRSLLRSSVRMLSALNIYADYFQNQFIQCTVNYYRSESKRLVNQLEVADYLLHVIERLNQETERLQFCLDLTTRFPLYHTLEHELIEVHVNDLIAKGFDPLFSQNRFEDLGRMFSLFSRVKSQPLLLTALQEVILKMGKSLVADPGSERKATLIGDLLDLNQRQDTVIQRSFENDKMFTEGLRRTWSQILNTHQSITAELLAKYADQKLRGGEKSGGPEALEAVLDKVLVFFRLLEAKDTFEAFYKADLAKRLIMQRFASIDAENSFISKLKAECGSGFTAKLENMFKDMEVSKDVMKSFNESRYVSELQGFVLDVKVLTSFCWPINPAEDIILPKQLKHGQEVFEKFYLSKQSGRCLKWQHSISMTLIEAHPGPDQRKKELYVSLLQALCILLFNDADRLSFEQILDKTNIKDKVLRLTLQSLACGKVRVLKKEPKGREIEDGDVFSVDSEKILSNPLFRIKINNILAKETVEENSKTHSGVFKDRQYQIDAAIVRIMKTRKTLAHSQLVAQLFAQLKFPVKIQDLKKRIESLIDREYMERSKGDANTYNYLA
eukprot:c15781_g1_i2.p1 GENE.c15781_g1_i2~~c15781_g1_i2.p1  ORF type:complete len:741 (+),score=197.27 c15781_g1_i2:223-2223(+)